MLMSRKYFNVFIKKNILLITVIEVKVYKASIKIRVKLFIKMKKLDHMGLFYA